MSLPLGHQAGDLAAGPAHSKRQNDLAQEQQHSVKCKVARLHVPSSHGDIEISLICPPAAAALPAFAVQLSDFNNLCCTLFTMAWWLLIPQPKSLSKTGG